MQVIYENCRFHRKHIEYFMVFKAFTLPGSISVAVGGVAEVVYSYFCQQCAD